MVESVVAGVTVAVLTFERMSGITHPIYPTKQYKRRRDRNGPVEIINCNGGSGGQKHKKPWRKIT